MSIALVVDGKIEHVNRTLDEAPAGWIVVPDDVCCGMIVNADGSFSTPTPPQKTYQELRAADYPMMQDQFDMIYHDNIDGTTVWLDTIQAVKTKHPKQGI